MGKLDDDADEQMYNEFIDEFLSFPSSQRESVTRTEDSDSMGVIQVRNWLAGRSTTMSEDLYVVLARCLHFKLKQLNNFATSEEKWKAMLFSFPTLPFSLFCVSGSRLPAPDHWIPSAVGRDLLYEGSKIHLPGPSVSQVF